MRRFSLAGLLAVSIPASAQTDSLKALLRTDLHDTVRMEALRDLGYAITASYDNLDEGERNYRACMALAEREDNAYWLAYCTYGLAINYDVSGELSKALELLDRAETRFRAIGDLEYVGNVLNARGTAHYYQGITDKAMVHFMRALEYAEKNKLLLCESQALNNIAIVHRKGGEHREALVIYRRSIAVKQQLDDRRGMANTLSNMGVAYDRLDRSDSALASFEQAIAIYRELKDDYEVGATRIAMAEVHVTRAQNAEAVTLLQEAIATLKDSPEDQFNYAHAHLLLGRALTGVGRAREGLDHLAITEGLIATSERAEMLAELYRAKAEALHAIGEHRDAFEALKLSHVMQDSIQGEESKRSLEELRTRFDTQEKEKRIEVQGLQLEKQEQERRTFLAIMAGLVVLVTAAVVLIIGRVRSNRKLQVQKRIVEQALGEKELLLREIHHRVKNNLQTVSSLLSLQGRGITDEKAKEAVNDSRLRVKSMALIHQDLYREGDLTGVQMKDYVEKLATGLVTSYAMSDRVDLKLDTQDIRLDVDTAVPIGLILNELVTNALKYAWPDGRSGVLSIVLREGTVTGTALAIEVKDNGIGLKDLSSIAAGGSGFGLGMIRTFAGKLKAEHSITSDGGTCVRLVVRNYRKTG